MPAGDLRTGAQADRAGDRRGIRVDLEAELLQEDPARDREVEAADAAPEVVELSVAEPEASSDRVRVPEVQDEAGAARPGVPGLPLEVDVLDLETERLDLVELDLEAAEADAVVVVRGERDDRRQ